MIDFDLIFSNVLSVAKIIFPILLGSVLFRVGLRFIFSSLTSYGDVSIFSLFEKDNSSKTGFVNKKPVKLNKKYYPKKYDIPEKQRDFIQLN